MVNERMFQTTSVLKGDFVYYPRKTNVGGMNFYTVGQLYEHLRSRSPAD